MNSRLIQHTEAIESKGLKAIKTVWRNLGWFGLVAALGFFAILYYLVSEVRAPRHLCLPGEGLTISRRAHDRFESSNASKTLGRNDRRRRASPPGCDFLRAENAGVPRHHVRNAVAARPRAWQGIGYL